MSTSATPTVAFRAHHGRKRLLIGVVTLALALSAWLSIGASAALACTNFGPYLDGMVRSETTQGSQAYIARYLPRYCQSSSAWVMVQNSGNGDELAQIGWLRLASYSYYVYYFYEYGTPSQLYPPVELSAVPNVTSLTQDKYGVHLESDGYYHFAINTVGQFATPLSWTPNEGEWFAETHYNEDQTAGDTSNVVDVTGVAHYNNGTWYQDKPASSYAYNDSPYGSGLWGSDNSFDVYDGRYSSEGP